MKTIEGTEAKIRDVAAEGEHGREVRTAADAEARRAIALLLKLLAASLEGEKLRGAPNLVLDWTNQRPADGYYGYRVRGEPDTALDAVSFAKPIGRPVLVLNDRGKLVFAFRVIAPDDRRYVEEREVDLAQASAELRSGDLLALLEVLEEALPKHVELAQRAKAKHVQARELALLIAEMIGAAEDRGLA